MKVLALELSSPVGSVALSGGSDGPAFRTFPADRKDSGFFFENLRAIYDAGGPPDLIIVGLGPGSYAGVRIAIATAVGLKIASGARLLGLPSICAIDQSEYVFVGDARRSGRNARAMRSERATVQTTAITMLAALGQPFVSASV